LGLLPVEALLLIADVLHGLPHDGFDLLLFDGAVLGDEAPRPADLAGDHDPVGRHQGFAGHAGHRIRGQERVDDRVGYAAADLVRMAFGHGLAREYEIPPRHGQDSLDGNGERLELPSQRGPAASSRAGAGAHCALLSQAFIPSSSRLAAWRGEVTIATTPG